MVQEVYHCFKRYFSKISSYQQINQSTEQMIQGFLAYCMSSIKDSSYHTHKSNKCEYSGLNYVLSYERSYVAYRENTVKVFYIKIPVFYCANCNHYHAILPSLLIIPYVPFSLAFILCVLNERYTNNMKIEDILEKYDLSQSTYYRWIKRYQKYYRIFLMMHNEKSYSLFIMAETQFFNLSQSIFYLTGSTLFEFEFKLFAKPT